MNRPSESAVISHEHLRVLRTSIASQTAGQTLLLKVNEAIRAHATGIGARMHQLVHYHVGQTVGPLFIRVTRPQVAAAYEA